MVFVDYLLGKVFGFSEKGEQPNTTMPTNMSEPINGIKNNINVKNVGVSTNMPTTTTLASSNNTAVTTTTSPVLNDTSTTISPSPLPTTAPVNISAATSGPVSNVTASPASATVSNASLGSQLNTSSTTISPPPLPTTAPVNISAATSGPVSNVIASPASTAAPAPGPMITTTPAPKSTFTGIFGILSNCADSYFEFLFKYKSKISICLSLFIFSSLFLLVVFVWNLMSEDSRNNKLYLRNISIWLFCSVVLSGSLGILIFFMNEVPTAAYKWGVGFCSVVFICNLPALICFFIVKIYAWLSQPESGDSSTNL